MAGQVLLYHMPFGDRMAIPQQNNRPAHRTQQMFQKLEHSGAIHGLAPDLIVQADLASRRTEPQRTNQIDTFMVLDARANRRRLAPGCPGAFQR